jgi:hypothetical protein
MKPLQYLGQHQVADANRCRGKSRSRRANRRGSSIASHPVQITLPGQLAAEDANSLLSLELVVDDDIRTHIPDVYSAGYVYTQLAARKSAIRESGLCAEFPVGLVAWCGDAGATIGRAKGGDMATPFERARILIAVTGGVFVAASASAHHGFGQFDRSQPVDLDGTITGIDFVNPHSYLRLDVTGANGEAIAMRCEMRAATLMRRSGWSEEMFVNGSAVSIQGWGHRTDPAACYIEDIRIGDAEVINRNDQFSTGGAPDLSNRPYRLASGEVNLSGDWAQEQYVIAVPPDGSPANLVPKSLKARVESGEIAMRDVPSAGWFGRPVTLTERGRAEDAAFANASPADNPRLRCAPTSILFDWTFDGAINRITQQGDRIVIDYGLYSYERVIHMNMSEHPADPEPHYAGHSIGRWEGDVLVVDTVGFAPGLIAGRVRNSEELHVVERFSLDEESLELRRDYVAEDPVYFTDQYVGFDVVLPADVPWVPHACAELAPEFAPQQ